MGIMVMIARGCDAVNARCAMAGSGASAGNPAAMTATATMDETATMATAGIAPFSVVNGDARADLLLVCEHASNAIPAGYDNLGLPPQALQRHIAYDIGAAAVACALARLFHCPAVLGGCSRLLIDLNRGLDDPTLVMKLSDGQVIPGNRHVDPWNDREEWRRRIDAWHIPYHSEVEARVRALQGNAPALISIHSFTPIWKGEARSWDIGVLWGADDRLAFPLISALSNIEGVHVGRNEPYVGGLEGESIQRHGQDNGILHACLELRQDQIDSDAGRDLWVARLQRVIPEALEQARKIFYTAAHDAPGSSFPGGHSS